MIYYPLKKINRLKTKKMNTTNTRRWTNNEWYLNTTGTNETKSKRIYTCNWYFFLEANEIIDDDEK
jgi:hypothetical protein